MKQIKGRPSCFVQYSTAFIRELSTALRAISSSLCMILASGVAEVSSIITQKPIESRENDGQYALPYWPIAVYMHSKFTTKDAFCGNS